MTLGDVVGGEVRSYKRIHVNYGGSGSCTPNTTVLNIIFHYNDLHFCSVRVGHKMPHKALASHKCKVYVYGNRVFVTGSELRKRGMPEIKFKSERYRCKYYSTNVTLPSGASRGNSLKGLCEIISVN